MGTHFELGQLLRSVSQQQEALALTLSADAWQLWHATPEDRIAPLELTGKHPVDAGKATQRAAAGRGDDRLGGDPYDLYAKRVADAASAELAAVDPNNRLTLFVFGDERLIHLFSERSDSRRIVGLAGSSDRVAADELDATVRGLLDELNLDDVKTEIAALEDGDPGTIERDLAAIARMAVTGGVDTYWFDFTAPVPGTLDLTTGELSYANTATAATDAGVSDLLARIAQLVHESGGRVVAVRGSDLAEAWAGPALARLRYRWADRRPWLRRVRPRRGSGGRGRTHGRSTAARLPLHAVATPRGGGRRARWLVRPQPGTMQRTPHPKSGGGPSDNAGRGRPA